MRRADDHATRFGYGGAHRAASSAAREAAPRRCGSIGASARLTAVRARAVDRLQSQERPARDERPFWAGCAMILGAALGVVGGVAATANTPPPEAPRFGLAAPAPEGAIAPVSLRLGVEPSVANSVAQSAAQSDAPAGVQVAQATATGRAPQIAPAQATGERTAAAAADVAEIGPPPWRRFAAPTPANPAGRPILAIVIDDVDDDPELFAWTLRLGAPLTVSIFPGAENATALAAQARAAGVETLLHLPMEPLGAEDPGPDAILTTLGRDENRARLTGHLDAFEGYVGVNNHMGSAATANAETMSLVLGELKRRGLLFLDSRTANDSLGWPLARRKRMPAAVNQLFLDNDRSAEEIAKRLEQATQNARDYGASVAIGHAFPETLAALEAWLAVDGPGDVLLVPISAVAAHHLGR